MTRILGMIVILLIVMILSVGCSANRHKATADVAKWGAANRTLVDITCPDTGCQFASLKVFNPEQMKIPKETNSWDFGMTFLNAVSALSPHYFTYRIAAEAFDSARSNITNSYNRSSETESRSNSSVNDSYNSSDSTESTNFSLDFQSTVDARTNTTTSTDTRNTTDITNTSTDTRDSYNTSGAPE